MTEKFFIDSLEILRITEKGVFEEKSTFVAAARFYYFLNFLNIDSLFEWSIYISLLYFYVNLWVVSGIKSIKIGAFFFLILSIFLWYLFSAGITKEVLQGLFYLIIYSICIKDSWIKSNYIKILIGSMILLFSAVVFREYYLLTAFFTLVVFFIFNSTQRGLLKGKSNVTHITLLVLLSLVFFLYAASILFPDGYEKIVTLRNNRYMYLAERTDTFIADLIENPSNNMLIYVGNYILNFTRLLFPVELVFIGKLYYLPFLIFQFMFSWLYYKSLREIEFVNNQRFLSLVFLTSFLIVSAMMEPDFGSWARHQSVCWMVSFEALCRKDDGVA